MAPGQYQPVNLADVQQLTYALFALVGDLPAATPSFTRILGDGVAVTDAGGGLFSIDLNSGTALWTGRDWHVCRMIDGHGYRFEIFDGYVVSTRALDY